MGGLFLIGLDGNAIFGHVIAWVLYEWGEPYLLVWQSEVDEGRAAIESVVRDVIVEMNNFIVQVNRSFELAGQATRLSDVRHFTLRESEVWKRYFKKFGIDTWVERTVMRWKVLPALTVL